MAFLQVLVQVLVQDLLTAALLQVSKEKNFHWSTCNKEVSLSFKQI